MRAGNERMVDTVQAEIAALGPWFHNIHLPDGTQTAPDHYFGDFPAAKWAAIAGALPADLSGARILDIGCNAGFYTFELARRGAQVLGIDMDERYLRQAEWANSQFGFEAVQFRKASVYEIGTLGFRPDLVVFMGVFYHLRHPLLALDMIADLEPDTLLFQTLTHGDEAISPHAQADADFLTRERLDDPAWPSMAFVETTFARDPTNWWIPNHAGVVAMLRSAGFAVDQRPSHEIYICSRERQQPRPWLDEAHRRPHAIPHALGKDSD